MIISQSVKQSNRNSESKSALIHEMAVDNATQCNRHAPSVEALNKGYSIGYKADGVMFGLVQETRSRSIT